MLYLSSVIRVLFLVLSLGGSAARATDLPALESMLIKQSVEWRLLKSVGWRLGESSRQNVEISVKLGNPLDLDSFTSLPDLGCKTLCISLRKDLAASNRELTKKLRSETLPALLNSPATRKAYRLKTASQTRFVTDRMSKQFAWEDHPVDGMGTGFEKHFTRTDVTLAELEASGAVESGEYASLSELVEETGINPGLYSSWKLKDSVLPSTAVLSLTEKPHQAGCAVALNSALHALLFSTYDSLEALMAFDRAYAGDVSINNAYFRTSGLVTEFEVDGDGTAKAKLGRQGVPGESGYIRALIDEEIDDANYAGENILIVSWTDEARADFIAGGGLGYPELDDDESEELQYAFDDLKTEGASHDEYLALFAEDYGFAGASLDMIRFWTAANDLLKSKEVTRKKLIRALREGTEPAGLSRADAGHFREAVAVLNRPFFAQTEVWGHPAGKLLLSQWLIALFDVNPRTPYAVLFYDYDLIGSQWDHYRDAWLGF